MKETILNSSDDDFIPLEAVNNLMDGEINEDLLDNEDKIIPGPELGDMGFKGALEATDELKVVWKAFEINIRKMSRKRSNNQPHTLNCNDSLNLT